jgi:antitoxin HicB
MKTKSLKYYMNLNYPIELQQLDKNDGGGYIASIPELGKDAFTGYGETVEEAIEDLNDTKEMLFTDYLEQAIEIPPPSKDEDYSGKFVIRLPIYLHRYLVEQSKANNVSLNTYCLALLSQGNTMQVVNKSLKSIAITMQAIKRGFSASNRLNVLPKQDYGGTARYFTKIEEVTCAKAS